MNPIEGRASTWSWVLFATVCVAYLVARQSSTPALFVASQVLVVATVLTVAVFTLQAFRMAPPGDERAVWGLLSCAGWMLVASEGYFSWYQIAVGQTGPFAIALCDWLNLAASSVFFLLLVRVAGLKRYDTLARFRFLTDAVTVVVLTLLLLFHLWSGTVGGQLSWKYAVRWATYSFLGVVMLFAVGWLWFGLRRMSVRQRQRFILLGVSVGVFAVGIIVAPFIFDSGAAPGVGGWSLAITGDFFLVGYSLWAIAAITRVRDRHGSWVQVMSRPMGAESEWVTGAMSLFTLCVVILGAVWAFNAPNTEESSVYFALGVVATFALLARAALISFASGASRETALRDSLTGIGNRRAFDDQLEAVARLAQGSREAYTTAVLNLDDFARVNDVLGRRAGDDALCDVAEGLVKVVGSRGTVFRLAGDEFAVIASGLDADRFMSIASELLASVSDVYLGGGLVLSASMGVASSVDASADAGELAEKAIAAQVWSKYHGRGSAVRYDERIVHALGSQERLSLDDKQLHYSLARALAVSADARDPHTVYHSRNVAAIALMLGESVGMTDAQLTTLEIAAMLHDVGRIALPDEVIARPLSASRRLAAQEHTLLGAQLVESVGVDGASAAVRSHHECWDGSGYPDGLSGEEITIESRIIALADAYDGMVTGRRSGRSMSRSAALQEIDHQIGRRFDPALAEIFINVIGTTSSLGWSDKWAVLG
ncbi:MAG: HD domain-containing phosphohydrolase [Coriobacteriia bacterium]